MVYARSLAVLPLGQLLVTRLVQSAAAHGPSPTVGGRLTFRPALILGLTGFGGCFLLVSTARRALSDPVALLSTLVAADLAARMILAH